MEKKNVSSLSYMLTLAGKYRVHAVLSIILGIGSALCTFIPFVMVYQVFLFLFGVQPDFSTAFNCAIIAVIAIVAKFFLQVLSGTFSHLGAFNTLYNIRSLLSRHISKINLGFFTSNTIGRIKKVIIEDIERIETFLAHHIPDIASAVSVPIIVFFYLLTINVPMALCLLVPVVLGLIVQLIAMKITGPQMKIYHRLMAKLNSTIMQFINGMPVMKTYNLTTESYKEYVGTVEDYNEFWKSSTKAQGYTYGLFVTLVESGLLFVLPIGGYLYLQGSLELSAYLFFMIMSMVFLSTLLNLINFSQAIYQILIGVRGIQDIMEIPEAKAGDICLDQNKNHNLSFEKVSFSYDATEVLKNVSIDLPKGSLTAFVGSSGAGKTTAAQLIPKFWEVSKGAITIDGNNINEIKTENLMDLVSFVFQETFMLNDTIYENIAIGRQRADQKTVEDAAKAAQIHDFIVSLPEGYQTLIGESGVKMSGGEKQRICIARAILKNAPIIVFDEATSFTDMENEHKIQLALKHLLKDKTTIMIAHRLHTIINADQICVFDKGVVVEKGTHKELLDKKGSYSQMWQTYIEGEGAGEVDA